MYAEGGVGLAAQQIGVPLRLFVMDCDGIKLVAATLKYSPLKASKRVKKAACRLAKFTPTSTT